MKEWTIEVYILDQNGEEHPARCFTKVVYNLHPSFANPIQSMYQTWPPCPFRAFFFLASTDRDPQHTAFTEPPFKCTNEGWGEFELMIDLYTTEKGGKNTVLHDLNFAKPTYENIHKVVFKNPSQALQQILRETGPLPSDEERKTKKADASGRTKKRAYDIEKIAEGLPKLGEDDLLQVIQMIHDGKSDNTYMQNNVDGTSWCWVYCCS